MCNVFRCIIGFVGLGVLASTSSLRPVSSETVHSDLLLQGPLVATTSLDENHILLFDVTTQQARTLSFGAVPHMLTGFSPDGCEILFTLEQTPQTYDLFAARLDGSSIRQLVFLGPSGARHYRVWEPAWSPVGDRIAFTLIRYYYPPDDDPYRESHIAWVPPEGGAPQFYSTSGQEWQPRWSPDGRLLAYVSEQPVLPPDQSGELSEEDRDALPKKAEIWVLHSDESNKYRLVSIGDGAVYNPRWSPDGDTIAFVYEPVGNLHHIMLIPADGSSRPVSQNQALITVLDFDWHPDGRGLAVAAQGIQDIPQNALWFFSNREIRSIGDQQMPLFVDYPRYGPDGRWLAFRSAYELTVYDAQQNRVHGFGPDSYNNNPPVWSPAGFQGEAACLP